MRLLKLSLLLIYVNCLHLINIFVITNIIIVFIFLYYLCVCGGGDFDINPTSVAGVS